MPVLQPRPLPSGGAAVAPSKPATTVSFHASCTGAVLMYTPPTALTEDRTTVSGVYLIWFSISTCEFTDGAPTEIFGQAIYDPYEPSRFMDSCTSLVILSFCFRYV